MQDNTGPAWQVTIVNPSALERLRRAHFKELKGSLGFYLKNKFNGFPLELEWLKHKDYQETEADLGYYLKKQYISPRNAKLTDRASRLKVKIKEHKASES